MKKRDEADILRELDRLTSRYRRWQAVARLLLATYERCGHPACNIGGGPCADCGAKRQTYLNRLRELVEDGR